MCFHLDRYRGTDSDDSESDVASSYYSSAGSDDGGSRPSDDGSSGQRPGLTLDTRLDSQTRLDSHAGVKADGGGQRSPLRAFLRRHVQRGGRQFV